MTKTVQNSQHYNNFFLSAALVESAGPFGKPSFLHRLGSDTGRLSYRPYIMCIAKDLLYCKCNSNLVGFKSRAESLGTRELINKIDVSRQDIQRYSDRAGHMKPRRLILCCSTASYRASGQIMSMLIHVLPLPIHSSLGPALRLASVSLCKIYFVETSVQTQLNKEFE